MKILRVLALVLLAAVGTAAQTTQFNGVVKDLTETPIGPLGYVAFTLKPGIDTTISGNARFTPTTVNCTIVDVSIVSAVGNGVTTTITTSANTNWAVGDQLVFSGTGTALDLFTVAAPAVINGGALTTVFTIASTYNGTVNIGYVGGLYANAGTGKCVVTQNTAINPANTSYSVAIQVGTAGANATVSTFNTYAIGAGPIDISTIVPTPSQQPSYSFVDLFSNGQTISGLKTFTNTGNTYSGGTFNSPTINTPTITGFACTSCSMTTPTIIQPLFTTQPITLQATFNYSLSWTNPAAARAISIIDPLGTDSFLWTGVGGGQQSVYNKDFQTGIGFNAPPSYVGSAAYAVAGAIGLNFTTGRLSLTAQNSSVGTTTFYTYTQATTQPFSTLKYSLITTTNNAGGGTVSVTLTWPDCSGGVTQTRTSATISLVTLSNEVDGSFYICLLSGGNVTYSTTDSSVGVGAYALRVWMSFE